MSSIISPSEFDYNKVQYTSPYVSIATIIVIRGETEWTLFEYFCDLGIHPLTTKLLSQIGVWSRFKILLPDFIKFRRVRANYYLRYKHLFVLARCGTIWNFLYFIFICFFKIFVTKAPVTMISCSLRANCLTYFTLWIVFFYWISSLIMLCIFSTLSNYYISSFHNSSK